MLQKLPIGLQSFKKIRQDGYLYIDKTEHIYRLINSAMYNFLSRPRRFGKSLLMDTIHQLYAGEKELFSGLWIENNWDWDKKKCPVVKIVFGNGLVKTVENLNNAIDYNLKDVAQGYHVDITVKDIGTMFKQLIKLLAQKYQQRVVVLIDEYDKPILDNINNLKIATEIRDELRGFYSVLKDSDQYLEFVLITGVSKFSKVSLFSGLNNLEDLSLDPNFGDICGYTEQEVKDNFTDYLVNVDFAKMQQWYNGFNFLGKVTVFNPYDILNFLKKKEYNNYWFETATPSFLIKMIEKNKYYIPDIENIEAGSEIIKSFDIEKLSLTTLLFQAGYLTIEKVDLIGVNYVYKLKYPNLEIKKSLTDHILSWLVDDIDQKAKNQISFYRTLFSGNIAEFENVVKQILASLPYNWFINNNMAEYEGYYCSVIYCYFYGLGLDVIAEDATSKGRIDLTLKLNNRIFIFEFKVEKSGKSAMEQIKERKYWEKYANPPNSVILPESRVLGTGCPESLPSSPPDLVILPEDSGCPESLPLSPPDKEDLGGLKNPPSPLYQGGISEIYLVAMEFDEEKRELTKYEWERI